MDGEIAQLDGEREEIILQPVPSLNAAYEHYGKSISRLADPELEVTSTDIQDLILGRYEISAAEMKGLANDTNLDEWTREYHRSNLELATKAVQGDTSAIEQILSEEIQVCDGTCSSLRTSIEKAQASGETTKVANYRQRLQEEQQRILSLQKGRSLVSESRSNDVVADDFENMTELQQERYIRELAQKSRVYYRGHEGGYYLFGLGAHVSEIPQEQKLLEAIALNKDVVLTPEQEMRLFESEKNVSKVHLAIPDEQKALVLQKVMSAHEADDLISRQIGEQKQKQGLTTISDRELIDAGSLTVGLGNWKMNDSSGARAQEGNLPDFVFYVEPRVGMDYLQVRDLMVSELATIIEPLNIPATGDVDVPRYSQKASVEGGTGNGIYISEGNSDFKDYLMRTGGVSKLSRFYDPGSNFSKHREAVSVT